MSIGCGIMSVGGAWGETWYAITTRNTSVNTWTVWRFSYSVLASHIDTDYNRIFKLVCPALVLRDCASSICSSVCPERSSLAEWDELLTTNHLTAIMSVAPVALLIRLSYSVAPRSTVVLRATLADLTSCLLFWFGCWQRRGAAQRTEYRG